MMKTLLNEDLALNIVPSILLSIRKGLHMIA